MRQPGTGLNWSQPAKRLGITVEEYTAKRNAGQLWCCMGKHWEDGQCFGRSVDRPGGKKPSCRTCINADAMIRNQGREPKPLTPEQRAVKTRQQADYRIRKFLADRAVQR